MKQKIKTETQPRWQGFGAENAGVENAVAQSLDQRPRQSPPKRLSTASPVSTEMKAPKREREIAPKVGTRLTLGRIWSGRRRSLDGNYRFLTYVH
jgi:hypothetical protein